jgi:hypothetical protein
MYEKEIQMLQEQETLVLCQTTLNLGGYQSLEPNITRDAVKLDNLIALLGGPKHIRARFDPIIFGFTTPKMFAAHCKYLADYGITRTTVNFMVFIYKDVRDQFKAKRFPVDEPTPERKRRTLEKISEIASRYNIEVAACAETSAYAGQVPGILPAKCSDPGWALFLRPDLEGKVQGHSSRKGCGCIYSDDWGVYRNKGGWLCPNQCLYCYAK